MLPRLPLAFVVKANNAWTRPVGARRLASAGRLDVVARALIAASSSPVSRYTLFIAVLCGPPSPPVALVADCSKLAPLTSETEFAEALSRAYSGTPPPGLRLARAGFGDVLRSLANAGYRLYYLHEEGSDIRSLELGTPATFVLGDHIGLRREDEELLDSLGVPRVSLGPLPYFTSHCITLVCEEVARRKLLSQGRGDRNR